MSSRPYTFWMRTLCAMCEILCQDLAVVGILLLRGFTASNRNARAKSGRTWCIRIYTASNILRDLFI